MYNQESGTTKPGTVAWQNAYNAGFDARLEGVRLMECPFPDGSVHRAAWMRGWYLADQGKRMQREEHDEVS